MNARLIVLIVASGLLVACAATPDRLDEPDLRESAPLQGLPTTSTGNWPAQDWWKRYRDPQLDRLMDQAVNGSTSLLTAESRVQQAQQSAQVIAASNGVRINGNAQVSRQRLSEHGLIPAQFLGFTWYSQADLGVRLDYGFDWWGKHRASVEAALGQVRAAQAQHAAAVIALHAAVADTYFAWQADQARIQLSRRSIAIQTHVLHVSTIRTRAGLQPDDQRLQAQSTLDGLRQQLAQLKGAAAIRLASLAALLGQAPAELDDLKARSLPDGSAGLPAHASLDLLARRADIAASRWQVEAALRGTDVARADFLPDLSISALAGLSSIDLGKLFTAGSRTFALTPALHLPIFESGLLEARYGQARARLAAAIANYNDTVINAARDVATQTLTANNLRTLQERQSAQQLSIQALAGKAQSRHERGLTDMTPVWQARMQVLQQRDAAAVLKARAVSADIALTRALGGGYFSEPVKTGNTHQSETMDIQP